MEVLRRFVLAFTCCAVCTVGTAQEPRSLKGRVTDGGQPIADVTVRIAGMNTGSYTDESGYYSIPVRTRDTVVFTRMGFKPYRFLVEDVSRILNPVLVPDIVELDEVVVRRSRRKSQADLHKEYPLNENLFRTAFGIIDAETAPNQVRVIPGDQISPIGLCILDFMKSRFPGVRVIGDCLEGGRVLLRGGIGSLSQQVSVVWDVDGMIFQETPLWLNLGNIRRMAIIGGLGFTAKYGRGGGVIVINTMASSPSRDPDFDLARLRNNYLRTPVPTREDLGRGAPDYLKYLRSSPNLPTARQRCDSLIPRFTSYPFALVDAYAFFTEDFPDATYAARLVEDHGEVFDSNPLLLKAMAYYYESRGQLDQAESAYEQVFRLRPRYAQSYLDMARLKVQKGEVHKAVSLYQRYNQLVAQGSLETDTLVLAPLLAREWNNLLLFHRKDLKLDDNRSDLFIDPDEEATGGTRIVVDWNDGDADFELQFVNPEGQYHTWKHSVFEDAEAIMREKVYGFNTREFLMDNSFPGLWRVNVKYLGNKKLSPSYLKFTIYTAYGTPAQRSSVKVYKLRIRDLNYELFTLDNQALATTR